MKYKNILSIILLSSAFIQVSFSQEVLDRGMINYQLSRSGKNSVNAPEDHLLLFEPNSTIHVTIAPNSEGSTIIHTEFDSSRCFVFGCNKGDTTVYSVRWPFYESLDIKSPITIKQSQKKTKEILGFTCFRVSVRPKKGKKNIPFKIDAWVTDRIKSRYTPIVDFINWGGLPLELKMTDIKSDSSVVFKAKRIAPLDDSLIAAYKYFVEQKSKMFLVLTNPSDILKQFEEDAKRKRDFQADTSISFSVLFEAPWEKVDSSHLMLSLENKILFARCRILRESKLRSGKRDWEFENTLRDKVHFTVKIDSPKSPVETISFRGKMAKQQTWNFKKQTFVDKHFYSKEENPYNFYPEENLIELCRVFAINDIECVAVVTTTKTNLPDVIKSVEKMLESMTIKGL